MHPVLLIRVKNFLFSSFPVRIDAPSKVALFAYDNGAFVVESFLPQAADVQVSIAGKYKHLRNIATNQVLPAASTALQESVFKVRLNPHSFLAFKTEE